jgi:uncharacterized protein YuzE
MVSEAPRYPRGDEKEATMKYYYDAESDSLFISLRDGEYDESEEIYEGFVIDFDKSGRPLNIDIDHASQFVDIPRLLRSMAPEPDEPEQPR